MEVLISIGVVSIGLLGVAALIPVAQFKAAQGILEDRKAVFGRRAVREFRIRGMNSPGTADNPNWLGPPNWQAKENGFVFDASGNVTRQAYCLDPMLVARALDEGGNAPSLVRTFPYSGHTAAKMWRITLRASPAPDPATPVTSLLADEMFRLPDDLVFQVPSTRPELPPLRQYLMSSTASPQKALAEGNLSWMATIVPSLGVSGDEYIVSVVIFNRRTVDPTEEVVAEVADIEGTLGQGEIILADESELSPPPKYRIKDIRVGDWLMLSQLVVSPKRQDGTQPPPNKFFRWTRVINADENYDVAGVNREFTVSLSGMDVRSTAKPHAVWVKGVVAVYEKTIRLENSSLWN